MPSVRGTVFLSLEGLGFVSGLVLRDFSLIERFRKAQRLAKLKAGDGLVYDYGSRMITCGPKRWQLGRSP